MLKLGQVMLAAKAGATYISIFAGRVADEGKSELNCSRLEGLQMTEGNTLLNKLLSNA